MVLIVPKTGNKKQRFCNSEGEDTKGLKRMTLIFQHLVRNSRDCVKIGLAQRVTSEDMYLYKQLRESPQGSSQCSRPHKTSCSSGLAFRQKRSAPRSSGINWYLTLQVYWKNSPHTRNPVPDKRGSSRCCEEKIPPPAPGALATVTCPGHQHCRGHNEPLGLR